MVGTWVGSPWECSSSTALPSSGGKQRWVPMVPRRKKTGTSGWFDGGDRRYLCPLDASVRGLADILPSRGQKVWGGGASAGEGRMVLGMTLSNK